jgi:hypothetical protein
MLLNQSDANLRPLIYRPSTARPSIARSFLNSTAPNFDYNSYLNPALHSDAVLDPAFQKKVFENIDGFVIKKFQTMKEGALQAKRFYRDARESCN